MRELQNTVERLAILTTDDRIDQVFIETVLSTHKKDIDLDNLVLKEDDFQLYKETAERIFLKRQLQKNDWNISRTAEAIGLQRSHVYNKMKKYNIER